MAGESWQHPGAPVEAGPGNGTRILFDQPLEGPPQLDSTTGMAWSSELAGRLWWRRDFRSDNAAVSAGAAGIPR
jgi:hypothetical protein